MISKEKVFQQVKKKWYAQGFNCTPLLLSGPAMSGFDVKSTIGRNYKSFLWEYKNEYGKMYYGVEDLQQIGKLLVAKIKKEKNYIKKLRQEDQQRQRKVEQELLILPETNYAQLSDSDLYTVLRRGLFASRDVGRIAHIIEGFSLTADQEIKEKLEKYVTEPKKLNEYLSLLSRPTEASFIQQREEEISQIAAIKNGVKREKAIKKCLKKYYWVRNTYAGRVRIGIDEIKEEILNLNYKPLDFPKIKLEQEMVIKKLRLDDNLVQLLHASGEITAWQDERKKNIFIIIDVIEGVMEEFSRRLKIDQKLLRYFTYNEIMHGQVLEQKNIRTQLEERRAGVVHYAVENNEEIILVGENYKKFHLNITEEEKKQLETKEFKGTTACVGVAIGKVRICTSLAAIKEFKEDEILVASMTRPEYLPAMKKAAAIVTDEGGITCHAAIVSRELGKPCVIGTKIATKVLKDGEMIEVDPQVGIVRKIHKK